VETNHAAAGVDTLQDLERVRTLMQTAPHKGAPYVIS
jgi:hypothetical protein